MGRKGRSLLVPFGLILLAIALLATLDHASQPLVWLAFAGLVVLAANVGGLRQRLPLLSSAVVSESVLGWAIVGFLFVVTVLGTEPAASSTSQQAIGGGSPSS